VKTVALLPMVVAAQLYSQDSTAVKTPRKVLTYSIVPGGGQLYNGKPLKAAMMMGAQIWMLYQFSSNRSQYNGWESGDPNPREQYRDNRNKYAWYSAFVYIYNLADALVDSHLAGFDEKDESEADDKTEKKGTEDG
jgi:hypothetical protein